MLSLAKKAGKVVSGEFSAEHSVKSGKAVLVIVTQDASDNTKKKFADMCSYRHIEYRIYSDKEALGRCLGVSERAVAAVEDGGFARAVLLQMERVRG